MKVILDTNVLVSALLSPVGMPARIVRAWLDERFILVSHPLQLDELRDVTRRDRVRANIRPANAGRLVNQIARLAELPANLPPVERSPDPRDDFLLALCEAAGADWLATGDKADLLALERHGGMRIVTAARLAAELGVEGERGSNRSLRPASQLSSFPSPLCDGGYFFRKVSVFGPNGLGGAAGGAWIGAAAAATAA